MAFKTNRLVVDGVDQADSEDSRYEDISQVPGIDAIASSGYHALKQVIQNNLDKPSLCIQMVQTEQPTKVAYDSNGDIIAAYGWNLVERLGKGKDGTTFWGYRFGDKKQEMNIVKVLSGYAQMYNNHTEIFNAILRSLQAQGLYSHPLLTDHVIKSSTTYYKCSKPFTHIQQNKEQIHNALAKVCQMNAWCIDNTGFVFWDLGYSNGRNFMVDSTGKIKWVDYGGAGMLQCNNFKDIYKSHKKTMPVLTLEKGFPGKESLVLGNSDFVMSQFLLNYEFWSQPKCTADLYSSMLQVKTEVIPEITKWVLPNVLQHKTTKSLYAKYKGWDWLDSKTWKSIGKDFNAIT